MRVYLGRRLRYQETKSAFRSVRKALWLGCWPLKSTAEMPKRTQRTKKREPATKKKEG